jgi:WD40 repeat protein
MPDTENPEKEPIYPGVTPPATWFLPGSSPDRNGTQAPPAGGHSSGSSSFGRVPEPPTRARAPARRRARRRRRVMGFVELAAGGVVLAGLLVTAALVLPSAGRGKTAAAPAGRSAARPGTVIAAGRPVPGVTSANHASTVPGQETTVAFDTKLVDPHSSGVVSAGFDAGGRVVAIDGNGTIYVWDTATKQVAATLTEPGKTGIATAVFGPGGQIAATAGRNGETVVWSLTKLFEFGARPGLNTRFLVVSPGGDTLLTEDGNHDGIAMQDVREGNYLATLSDPDKISLTSGVTLSRDGRTLAVNDASGRTYLWDTLRRAVLASWHNPGAAQNFAAFSPDGKTLAESSGYGKVSLWDVSSHRPAGSVPIPAGTHLGALAISPDGKFLAEASLDSDSVYLWDLPTGKEFPALSDSGGKGAVAIAFSPDGKTLAAGDSDGSTYLWSIRERLALSVRLLGTSTA